MTHRGPCQPLPFCDCQGHGLAAGPSRAGGVERGGGVSPSSTHHPEPGHGPTAQGRTPAWNHPASWPNAPLFQTSPDPKTHPQDSQARHRPQPGLQLHPLSKFQSKRFEVGVLAFQKGGPALHTLLPSSPQGQRGHFRTSVSRNGINVTNWGTVTLHCICAAQTQCLLGTEATGEGQ